MGYEHEEDGCNYSLENFDGYFIGWAILILVLLLLLVWAGYAYVSHGDARTAHGGAYVMEHSMSPSEY